MSSIVVMFVNFCVFVMARRFIAFARNIEICGCQSRTGDQG